MTTEIDDALCEALGVVEDNDPQLDARRVFILAVSACARVVTSAEDRELLITEANRIDNQRSALGGTFT